MTTRRFPPAGPVRPVTLIHLGRTTRRNRASLPWPGVRRFIKHSLRRAAAGHSAWAQRVASHPRVIAALAAGQVSESAGRVICLWTGKLPTGAPLATVSR